VNAGTVEKMLAMGPKDLENVSVGVSNSPHHYQTMSAKTTRQFPRDRHGFVLSDGIRSKHNPDLEARWSRKYRFFQFIKAQTEPKRQQLATAYHRIDRLEGRP
jgi:hypothetical protein